MSPSLVQQRKQTLRAHLRSKLQSMTPSIRRRKSAVIEKKVLKSRVYQEAESVMVYLALPTEVQTLSMIRRMLKDGKKVFAPVVSLKPLSLRIYRVYQIPRDLRRGSWDILEPRRWKVRLGKPKEIDLAIIPGLGFTKTGKRLGRGLGFFDRFLNKLNQAEIIGITYREQILKKIPTEKHDLKVKQVITD